MKFTIINLTQTVGGEKREGKGGGEMWGDKILITYLFTI